MKAAFPFVRIYRLLGRRWTGRGWFSQPDDVFFLTVPDVERIMEAEDPTTAGLDPSDLSPSGRSLRTLTADRRKAYAYWFDVEAPEVIGPDGRLDGLQRDGAIGLIGHRMGIHASERGHPSRLIQERVRLVPQDDLVAAAAVGEDGR